MSGSWRALDGVLLFDKPLGLSSNAAIQKLRRLFQAEKAGHTGTLDPLASGLLPVCFGEATKYASALLDADKSYCATLRLGVSTTTGDAEGEVIETRPVAVSEASLREVLQQFLGHIQQIPPMHSALKYQGKPLYEYMRKGEVVERQAREVTIHALTLEHFTGDELKFSVRCSKGTYVRTLGEDIGRSLGCGGHLTALRRTGIGSFTVAQAHTLEALQAMDEAQRDACLLPVDALLQELPRLELDAAQALRLARGQKLGRALQEGLAPGIYRLYAQGRFAGTGEYTGQGLVPLRLLSSLARQAAGRDTA